MAHAEALKTLPPQVAATAALVKFVGDVRYAGLSDEVRHYARRHVLDTVGVMIAGAAGEVATRAEAVLAAVRLPGHVPVPGRARRADLMDAAFLGGTAAHGIELDDGFTQGSVHPGCVVIPTALALACARRNNGRALMEAVVTGYEAVIAIGRACHPDLRQRGFHPTAAVGVFGAAAAAGKLAALSPERLAHAFGLAASSAGGLFAFVNGGGDIKRLHAGHAAREGLQAALLAEQGVEGPPGVIEARDGFVQAFARAEKARGVVLPPAAPFGITDCYIKPNPCCRHIQPAVEALIGLLEEENITGEEVERVEVATYRIAAEHAATGWDDFASAQLSFPYLIALALKFRGVKFEHFADAVRRDPALAAMARKLTVTAPPEVDRLYPQLRPARVTVATARGSYTRQVEEARGSRLLPLDDAALKAKFLDLVGPELGAARAKDLAERLWSLDAIDDVASLVDSLAKPPSAAGSSR
ncbi:MAG TPA: MmgE/PrpD family protein [Xanthobacteraceae bacterium]|nr:MmgE/PrpD family protein [Xanthobacteraceae bacterium]